MSNIATNRAVKKAEVLVVGVGGCGASALYHLARRGISAIGIDRFLPGHDRGSSHGDTRIIRQAYFEHPDYVPLLRRAYQGWRDLEQETDEDLFNQCGLLLLGPGDGEVLRGARLARERYRAPLESVSREMVESRFPSISMPEDFEAAWEPVGGFLHVEKCVKTYARQAVSLGAELCLGESVQGWSANENGVRVETDQNRYEADRLVLCPGAWAPQLLPEIADLAGMRILRKVLLWFPRQSAKAFVPNHAFFAELPYGHFYGFPCLDGQTVKLAEHTGGDVVEDPLSIDRQERPNDAMGPRRFVSELFPGLAAEPVRQVVCMYTMTGDAQFIVDHHPIHPNVVFAAGFSGHGFKFMSAFGEILCELTIDGKTSSPIDFLGIDRFRKLDDRT